VKAVIQRVSRGSVSVAGNVVGSIGPGLVVLLGVAAGDTEKDAQYLVQKIVNLRIFTDAQDKINLSALDVKGELLLISQFTLLADTIKGRRPSFIGAAPPEQAEALFNYAVGLAKESGLKVEIHNDGPVTIMLDSREKLGQP
jgi:D-tyrosyl-tRNA(Tyr) deacylase